MSGRSRLSFTRAPRVIAAVAAAVLGVGLVAGSAALAAPATRHIAEKPAIKAPASQIGYAVDKPLCATAVKPGHVTCFAMQRVPVAKGTAGAFEYLKNTGITAGPAGGKTPADLALMYHFDPSLKRSSQTVGIVDWYNDPHINSDLAAFDKHYGFKKETKSSFRVVNEHGKSSPLPSSSKGRTSADEIALDVDTVRGICHTCKILLVEASGPTDSAIALAENTAAKLGATEISNSFGGPEPSSGSEPASMVKAFNHPGVVITASTGDDGWWGWDVANGGELPPQGALFPSTSPDVVSVGGTGDEVTNDTTGAGNQYVWDNNGPDDQVGSLPTVDGGGPEGAGGGGCSHLFASPAWQKSFPGYTAAGCSGKRLAADVSGLADPATGYDEYNTWVPSGDHSGWVTVGGTSLAAPMVAAMYALAGGSGGAEYPARSIYENASLTPADFTDIVTGGNGFCGGDTTTNCSQFVFDNTAANHTSPNALGAGNIDCSYPRNDSDTVTPPPLSSECNAVTGYDGPSGVGTPTSTKLFASTSPKVSLTLPKTIKLHHSVTFKAAATPRVSGQTIAKIAFNFGDGHTSTGTATAAAHTYTKAGVYTVTVTVTDSLGQVSIAHAKVGVNAKSTIKVFGEAKVKVGKKAKYEAIVTDPNTGAKVKKIHWAWGDGKTSNGVHVSHTWHKAGTYKLTVTVKDSDGVTTKEAFKIKVKS